MVNGKFSVIFNYWKIQESIMVNLYSLKVFTGVIGETPEDPECNDALRLEGMDDDFGDRDPERNGILRLEGMRESGIVNTY